MQKLSKLTTKRPTFKPNLSQEFLINFFEVEINFPLPQYRAFEDKPENTRKLIEIMSWFVKIASNNKFTVEVHFSFVCFELIKRP